MAIPAMRWIDKYVGNILIAALSSFRKRQYSQSNKSYQNIIVSKYFGIGSILMSTPLLQLLKSLFPRARIVIVTLKKNEPLLRLFPFIDDVILIDGRNFITLVRSTVPVIRALQRLRIDIFFDLEFFARYSAIVSFLSGAPVRVGFDTAGNPRKNILTNTIEVPYPKHIPYVFLSQVVALGLISQGQIDEMPYSIYNIRDAIPRAARESAKTLLQDMNIRDYVVFNATGGEVIGKEREWPANSWSMLAKLVETQLGLDVIFSGEKTKAGELQSIVNSCRSEKIHHLAGATTLYEFIALISMARAVVTIDSAALHIARSVGTPSVSLHGPEPPVVATVPDSRHRVIYKGLCDAPCPCYAFYENKEVHCRYENQCMKAMSAEEVLGVLKEIVDLSSSTVLK